MPTNKTFMFPIRLLQRQNEVSAFLAGSTKVHENSPGEFPKRILPE